MHSCIMYRCVYIHICIYIYIYIEREGINTMYSRTLERELPGLERLIMICVDELYMLYVKQTIYIYIYIEYMCIYVYVYMYLNNDDYPRRQSCRGSSTPRRSPPTRAGPPVKAARPMLYRYVCKYTCIYIYIYRERYRYVSIYVYIYIYIL